MKHIILKASIILMLAFMFIRNSALSQEHPKNYFRNPLNIPIELAGNFGECRPNHFHTGWDIKTNQKENLLVHAAADGFIARAVMSHTGYGHTLYVQHPNGYTTVYAHLNDFDQRIMELLKIEQYAIKSWAIDKIFEEDQLPVKKGDFIAYSGNTGGSVAPHLHFEIRNTKTQQVYNNAYFGLPLKDIIAPQIYELAIYDGDKSLFLQTPIFVKVTGQAPNYSINPKRIEVPFENVKFAVRVNDFMNNSSNTLGIYNIKLLHNEINKFQVIMDKINFSENRYLNAYVDFKTMKSTGKWFQNLFIQQGNLLTIYPDRSLSGIINLKDNDKNEVVIYIEDAYQNSSAVNFTIKYSKPENSKDIYCSQKWGINAINHTDSFFKFEMLPYSLYDEVCFNYSLKVKAKVLTRELMLLNKNIPLHHWCWLSLKLNFPVPFELRNKIAFVHHVHEEGLPGNNPQSGMAAQYKDGWAETKVRTFGAYYAVIDTVAPIIKWRNATFIKDKKIVIEVNELITSIKTVNAFINEEWVMLERSKNLFTYTIDGSVIKETNVIRIEAVDENNNKRIIEKIFEGK